MARELQIDLVYGLRYDPLPMLTEEYRRISKFDPGLPNPAAGGLLAALTFFGNDPGRSGMNAVANTQHLWLRTLDLHML